MRKAVTLAAAALCIACGRTTEPVDADGSTEHVTAGDTIVLTHGQTAVLGNAARIVFRAVESDSRCPVDVTCVWEGDAHVRLEGAAQSAEWQPLDLHTALEPREITFAGFRIQLLGVSPQRRDGDEVRQRDYSVRLAISRG
jgi:hypothetical protein